MSTLYMFPPDQKPPEDSETLAGEYALGTMDAGEAAAARLRADTDPALSRAIGAWQARLATLIAMLPPAEPPAGLWDRLAADIGIKLPPPEPPRLVVPDPAPPEPAAERIDTVPEPPSAPLPEPAQEPPPAPVLAPVSALALAPVPPPLKFTLPVPVDPEPAPPPPSWPAPLPPAAPVAQAAAAPPDWPPEPAAAVPRVSLLDRLIVWRIAAGVLLLATTGLGVALLRSGPPPLAVAAIGVANAPAPLFLAEADAGGSLRLTPLAVIAVPNGRDLQLWMQPPGGKEPVSLGLLSASGSTVSLGGPPVEGTRLLISLEPRGGAMSGHITGQVLYGGTLANR